MRCCLRYNGIVQFWHFVLVVVLQSYVLVCSILKYISLRSQIFDARHGLDWDTMPLHFFLNCIVLSAGFTIIMTFLLCANQNYNISGFLLFNSSLLFSSSRTSITLDDSSSRTNSILPMSKKQTKLKNNFFFKSFPFAFSLHVLSAYFLLLPMPWVLGEQAKNEAVNPNLVWQTDLSFIFPILSPRDTMLDNTRMWHSALSTLSGSDLMALLPSTLGGIGQLAQTNQQINLVAELKSALLLHSNGIKTSFSDNTIPVISLRAPSPEIVNFFLALTFLAIQIATAFWTVWPTFSYLVSTLLIFSGVYLTVEFAAISLLIQLTACLTARANSTNIYDALIMVKLPMRFASWEMTLLTAMGYFFTLSSYGVLFYLGEVKFYKAVQKNYYTVVNVLRLSKRPITSASEQSATTMPCSQTTSVGEKRHSKKCKCWPLRDRALIALGFFSFIVSILFRMPCLYDIFLLYWNHKDYLCLTTIILFSCVNMAWFVMWLGFAMKQKWNFHLSYPSTMPQSSYPNAQNAFLTEPSVQGRLAYTPHQEFTEGTTPPIPSQHFFSALQLQNPGAFVRSPAYVPSVQLHPLSDSPHAQEQQQMNVGQILTNNLYETNLTNYSAGTRGGETLPLHDYFLLSPRRVHSMDPEISAGKLKINESVTGVMLPSQISCEATGNNETCPPWVSLQPVDECGDRGSTLLKMAHVAMQESGRSTATSADQICSRV